MNVGIAQIILYAIKQMQFGENVPVTTIDNSGIILFLLIGSGIAVLIVLIAVILIIKLNNQKPAGVKTLNTQVTPTTSATQVTMSFCSHCGVKIQQNTFYCSYCGKLLKIEAANHI